MPRRLLSLGERREILLAGLIGALCVGLHYLIFGRFLPGARATVGHDYARNHTPYLLAGHFFALRNGLLAVPWFTPAVCGGIPLLRQPQQPLRFAAAAAGPGHRLRHRLSRHLRRLSLAVGFWGTYLLLRRVFALRMPASVLGAVIVLFNGFYSHRFIVGHLAFHSFMLAPLIAYLLAKPLPIERQARRLARRSRCHDRRERRSPTCSSRRTSTASHRR